MEIFLQFRTTQHFGFCIIKSRLLSPDGQIEREILPRVTQTVTNTIDDMFSVLLFFFFVTVFDLILQFIGGVLASS